MHYHLILTNLCNSHCAYCYEKSMHEFDNQLNKTFTFDFSAPDRSIVQTDKLRSFLEQDPEPILIFYGGEPLLEIPKIKKVIQGLQETNVRFRMQTNGKLLHKLPRQYRNKIDKILISLDGTAERTDKNRGAQTYETVMQNLSLLKKTGYKGELVARMTITPPNADLYEQVRSLIDSGFTSVHWQIDAGFYKFDYDFVQFKTFVKEYNDSLSRLFSFWTELMDKGKVIKLYPFLAITKSMLDHEQSLLRCGAGHAGYTITTDGKVVACPIMNSIIDFEAGTLDSSPGNLKTIPIQGKCTTCDIKGLCGGRCLYWNRAKLWSEEGNALICDTIHHLIQEVTLNLPGIQRKIDKSTVSMKDFDYEKYFGPEIIP